MHCVEWHVLVYVCDEFSPVEADASVLFALAERDPIRLFEEFVKPLVEECYGDVVGVEAADVHFDPELGLVVEYITRHKLGEALARLIYSPNPERALAALVRRIH